MFAGCKIELIENYIRGAVFLINMLINVDTDWRNSKQSAKSMP